MKTTRLTLLTLFYFAGYALIPAAPKVPSPNIWYEVTDLGTLGGRQSEAYGINDRDQVVGWADTPTQRRAFLWARGKMTELPGLGGAESQARKINAAGQIVGYSETGQGGRHATLWSGGKVRDLRTLGGAQSEAEGINDGGQTVGWARTAKGEIHACEWGGAGAVDLGTLGGGFAQASSISRDGVVVGVSTNGSIYPDGEEMTHAFVIRDGKMRPLEEYVRESAASAICGSLVVGGTDDGGYVFQATVWDIGHGGRGAEGHRLGTLPGTVSSYAGDVNSRGEIVGNAQFSHGRPGYAFWYGQGRMINLNSELPARSGWVLEVATGINSQGQIVGFGRHHGVTHGFLLTPLRAANKIVTS